ncbi:hypothetical protein BOQ62_20320 [Chryseobacterium sp. CH21]|uniref:hypothetical protein n=1 Tax=Chryseobacterium sp. CH21 TaxID=713556 RepID=UPI00100B7FC2|nr:hypothetical protein [Chryseobacterium sp. CH21]RXM37869.1 hypothetical protein BOQ62_20320 [Chryseobacterium sp. CH21]
MKKVSTLVLAICSTMVFAQKVSDYKYVAVPEKFETFKEDYSLKDLFSKAMAGKKYIALPIIKDNWPADAKNNYCNVVTVDILKDKSLFKNKLTVQFKDCNNKMILESKGSSNIKDFEEGFHDALKQALITIPISNPVSLLPAATNVITTSTQSSSPEPVKSAATSESSNFSNGKLDLQKIQIDPSQFILAKSGSSVPFGVFKSTSKDSVFIVKLADGNMTIGYFENGNIVIDIPQTDGKYTKEIFTAK